MKNTKIKGDMPVLKEADVVVAGGGPAGLGAAIAAARNGAKTLLVESYGFFGGMWTTGGVNEFGAGKSGIVNDLINRLIDRGGGLRRDEGDLVNVKFEPEGMKLVLDELIEEEGVDVLLHASVVDTQTDSSGSVKGIVLGTKKGLVTVQGKCFVDATGDGDVVAFAGGEFGQGRDQDGLTSAPTLVFRIGNVDLERVFETFTQVTEVDGTDFAHVKERHYKGEPIRVYEFSVNSLRLARESGAELDPEDVRYFSEPKHPDLFHTSPLPGVVTVNMAHMADVDMVDPEDLTQTEMAVRKKIRRIMDFVTRYVPGFADSFLIDSGPHMGIRETRRFVGEYTLTGDDLVQGNRFADEILVLPPAVDIHHPDGRGTTKRAAEPGTLYGIPYRCLIPKDLDALIMAGRCISATVEANIKGTAKCMGIGQVAGTAAAMAVTQNIQPRKVDVRALQSKLRWDGIIE